MNCHDNNKENKKMKGHSPIKHMLHMVLCCGLPVLIIFALPFIARISPGAAGILGVIAPFLCPVMMIGMLLMMYGGRKKSRDCCDTKDTGREVKEENPAE